MSSDELSKHPLIESYRFIRTRNYRIISISKEKSKKKKKLISHRKSREDCIIVVAARLPFWTLYLIENYIFTNGSLLFVVQQLVVFSEIA